MRLSHARTEVSAVFDDPNLVSCAGLAPVVALGQSCGLSWLVADKLTVARTGGVNAAVKAPALVAGMVAGADCIDDMDLLRHGGMGRLFAGVRAPSTASNSCSRPPPDHHQPVAPDPRRHGPTESTVEQPDRPAAHPRPPQQSRSLDGDQVPDLAAWWIGAEADVLGGTPNSYLTAGVRRGTATSSSTRPGTTSELYQPWFDHDLLPTTKDSTARSRSAPTQSPRSVSQ